MVRLELLSNCGDETWDDLVASFKGGTIFHTLAWMRVVEKLYQAEKLPLGIYDGARLVGVFPLFRTRRGPLTIVASPLGGVGYGGPLVNRSHHTAVVEQLETLAQHLHADYIELRSLEELAPEALAERQYAIRELQTYVLSLNRDPKELWANLKGECRTAVRKARKMNVEIVEATDKSFLNVYHEMAKDTYSKSNRPAPLSEKDYSAVWDILRPYDRIKVLLARHEGQIIAGAIVLRFREKVYYWDGAGFRAHYRLNPNNLLHWTLIEWGANNGLMEYDMLGANIPGIARFKKSFGSELRTYTYAYKDVTLGASIGRRAYRWIAPLVRRIHFKLRSAQTT